MSDEKKVYVTPNFRNMRIVENPYLGKKKEASVIMEPSDVNKYWNEEIDSYVFSDLKVLCELDLSKYTIKANSISAVKTINASSIIVNGDINAFNLNAKEIKCVNIFARDVYVDNLLFVNSCTIDNLSAITVSTASDNPKCRVINFDKREISE